LSAEKTEKEITDMSKDGENMDEKKEAIMPTENNMAFPSEPMSEDDYPEDVHVISFPPFETEGKERSFNYIKEGKQDFYKPLNVQIDEADAEAPSTKITK
jgi:hypothetical protein